MTGFASDIAGAVGGLLGSASATPSVRRPVATIAFGAPAASSASDDPFGAVASAAESLLGGGASTDPFADAPVWVRVDLGLAPCADVVHVAYSASRGPDAALDDEAALSMGYADREPGAVFTGKVAAQRLTTEGARLLVLHNASSVLAGLRINISFASQTVGDIVSHLANEAGVETGRVDAGPTLPFFATDDRQTVYAQVAELAMLAGLVARINAEGKLDLLPLDGSPPVQTFTGGQDILSASLRSSTSLPGKRAVVGEGAAGGSGSDAWNWLIKDPASVKAAIGDGPGERVTYAPALRSNEAVTTAANAFAAGRARSEALLRLVVPGSAAVLPATVFEVAGAADAGMNAPWAALRVRHRLSKAEGFLTIIDAVKAGAGSGGSESLLGAIGGLP